MKVESVSAALIRTSRLAFIDMREEHRAFYIALFRDPHTMAHLGGPLSLERAEQGFDASVRGSPKRPHERYLIVLNAAGTAVGLASVQHVDLDLGCAEVGLMLEPASRNRGYAREALRALVSFAFATLPLTQVRACHAPDHAAAERLVLAVGFMPGDNGTEADRGHAMRSWSVHRDHWNCKEKAHVGRHRVLGADRSGCARA